MDKQVSVTTVKFMRELVVDTVGHGGITTVPPSPCPPTPTTAAPLQHIETSTVRVCCVCVCAVCACVFMIVTEEYAKIVSSCCNNCLRVIAGAWLVDTSQKYTSATHALKHESCRVKYYTTQWCSEVPVL